MHEYSVASALVARVARSIAARPGARVVRIEVEIGELAGVEIDLLLTAFEAIRDRGPCAGAELAIASVPAAWLCSRCRQAIAPGAVLRCPACDGPAQLVGGNDIILERIEMEVRDV